jgi:hypothetical protein
VRARFAKLVLFGFVDDNADHRADRSANRTGDDEGGERP